MVQPNIAAMELIERNMNDHRIANLIDGAVLEILEYDFQELELAMRNLIVGFMLG